MSIQVIANTGSNPDSALQWSEKTNANFSYIAGLIEANNNVVENSYATIAAMLADQSNQSQTKIQFVQDASQDATVTSGFAYYEYLGTVDVDIDDYRKLSQQETASIINPGTYNVMEVEAVQTNSVTAVSLGKLSVQHTNGVVENVVFNSVFSNYLQEYVTQTDKTFYLKLVNKTQQLTQLAKVTGFSVLNGIVTTQVGPGIITTKIDTKEVIEVLLDMDAQGEAGSFDGNLDDVPDGSTYVRAKPAQLAAISNKYDKTGGEITGDVEIKKLNPKLKISTGANEVGSVQGIYFIDRIGTSAGVDGQVGGFIEVRREGSTAKFKTFIGTTYNGTVDDVLDSICIDEDGNFEVLNGKYKGDGADLINVNAQKLASTPASDILALMPIETANTGTSLTLTKGGNMCNMLSANANAIIDVVSGSTFGTSAMVLINRATETQVRISTSPDVFATKIKGSDFIPSTDMHLVVQNLGSGVQYFFLEL